MALTKKQILSLIFFLTLLFALPLAIFLTQKRQDIRPRALQGKANFLLSSDKYATSVGDPFNVLVSMQLTDNRLQVSGVDFMLLYDKNKLDVVNILPQIQSVLPGSVFTDSPLVTSGGSFDDNFNYLRVVETAKVSGNYLGHDTVSLAKITFRSFDQGTAVIKFHEDNKYISIVGTGEYLTPTPCPAGGCPTATPFPPTVTPTPIGPTSTPSPTVTPGGPSLTPIPPTATSVPPTATSVPPTPVPLTVVPPTPLPPSPTPILSGAYLSVSPSTVQAGNATISVSWHSVDDPYYRDWIALYETAADNHNYIDYKYADGNSSGSVSISYNFEINKTYEFRYLLNDGYQSKMTSNTISIIPPPTATSAPTPVPGTCDQVGAFTNGWGTYSPADYNWGGLNEKWYRNGGYRYKYKIAGITYVRAWGGGLTEKGRNPESDTLLLQVTGSC